MTELIGERLPALSTAWTLNVFDVCVPYVIQPGNVTTVAVARELACFLWAAAVAD